MNSQLLFQRFNENWRTLAEVLDTDWPKVGNEFIRIAGLLRTIPDDSNSLTAFVEGAANRLVELLASHPAGLSFLTKSGQGAIVCRLASSGAGETSAPSGDAVANQYPPIKKTILDTADQIENEPKPEEDIRDRNPQ